MTALTGFTAIVLAGDRAADPLSIAFGGIRKALIEIGGDPMLLRVLRLLVGNPKIQDIIVCANEVGSIHSNSSVQAFLKAYNSSHQIHFLEGARTPATSVAQVLAEQNFDRPVLVTTADNVLMSQFALNQFLIKTANADHSDVTVGLAREADIRAAFPDVKRTYIRLGGYGYSGCNMFALMGANAHRAATFWITVEQERKHPWRLIRRFGWLTLAKALTGRLNLDQAMSVASRVMGIRVTAAVLDDPRAAMDIDRLEHWKIAQDIFSYQPPG